MNKLDFEPSIKQMILVRGIPGSGKSYFSKQLVEQYPEALEHFEADMFFEASGAYQFDPKLLSLAHDWCQSNAAYALLAGKSVIVSNTFTRQWELDTYFAIAANLEVPISIVEMKTEYGSVHGIPGDKLERMKTRWQDLSDENKSMLKQYIIIEPQE